MLFSMLLDMINLSISRAFKKNKSVQEMMANRNFTFVIRTKDEKIGRRYIFKDGKYSSDKVLTGYTLALIWSDADTAFKSMALGGQSALQEAQNDWKLTLAGDTDWFNFFGILLMTCLGKMKR